MSEVVTTEKTSAFALDPPSIPSASYQTIVQKNGKYYWIVTTQQPQKLAYRSYGGTNGLNSTWTYELTSTEWVMISDADNPFHRIVDGLNYLVYDQGKIVAQSWNSAELSSTYYPVSSFTSGSVPAPTGNVFDSIYSYDVFSGILVVLPLMLGDFIRFLAVRKENAFILGKLKGV